jgi:superfamily II DNA/RNA helicase
MFGSAEAKEVLDTCYKDNNDYNTYWKNVLNYCFAGNLQAVLDEYFYMIEEIYCLNSNNKNKKIVEKLKEAMSIRTTSFKIDTYDNFKKRINNQEEEPKKMRTNFAVCFSKGETEELENRRENIRAAFNSPFRPYVLTTTSIGQEGLDFHLYCRRIVHWNLPSNPIDLEQREGRINRFKCLAIRRYIANSNDVKEFKDNIWTEMFENVSEKLSEEEKHGGMVPYWTVPNEDKLEIERIVPIYEFSRDINNYNKIQNILDRYKLALGQENQEEIIEKIYKKEIENSEENKKKIKDLFFDLSPYSKKPKSNI